MGLLLKARHPACRAERSTSTDPAPTAGSDSTAYLPVAREPCRGPGRPVTAAGVLALLFCVGGSAAVAAAAFPMSDQAPVGLALAIGLAELMAGAALFLARQRVGAPVLHAGVVIRVAVASVLTTYAASAAGVALTGLAYVCLAVFAGYFFTRPVARAYAGLGVAGLTAGTLAGGVGSLLAVWLVVGVCVVAAGEVSGHLVAQLRTQAGSDPLTGLANRAGFRLAAQRQIALATRGRTALSLVVIDLDNFKTVNDTRGHLAGDVLLIEVADAWCQQLRAGDLLARYGGDEFALLLPATSIAQAARLLDRLRAAHPTRWSAGITCWAPGTHLDQMLEVADRELYRAKEQRPRHTG